MPIAVLVDALIVVLGALVAWIAATGGGIVMLGAHRVSLTGVDNPLLALAALCVLRYGALRAIPWFGVPRWPLSGIDRRARVAIVKLHSRAAAMTERRAAKVVGQVLLAALAVKVLLAWANPGFFSGDDVEVHEMSLRALWHTDWRIWDLRNAFFPLGVIYPFQWLFSLPGATSTATLVFAGRLGVAVLSSITVWLVWQAGRREWPDAAGWAAIAAVLFASASLHIAFGSSELPRPVATVFVVGAFALLQDPGIGRAPLAGVLLGVAACFRFSEVVFLGPALGVLVWQRRWTSAAAVVTIAGATALVVLGLTDAWYWGEALHSARAAVDFTLIHKLSSRGYQSVGWYLLHTPEWINPAVAALALVGTIAAPRLTDLWAWLPLLAFSALPHKEARYAIPLVPFFCLIATRGLQIVVARLQPAGTETPEGGTEPPGWRPVALLALLAVGFVHDVGHWRLPRTNADVRFAALANDTLPAGVVVSAEQAWRLGGHLYLHPHGLVDLDPDRLNDRDYLWQQTPARAWIIVDRRTTERAHLEDMLRARGYVKAPVAVEGSRYELWSPGGA